MHVGDGSVGLEDLPEHLLGNVRRQVPDKHLARMIRVRVAASGVRQCLEVICNPLAFALLPALRTHVRAQMRTHVRQSRILVLVVQWLQMCHVSRVPVLHKRTDRRHREADKIGKRIYPS